ncbi:hypothetical protein [Oceanicella sp. SM1341]|uniref:hypothetical protein n=1 Tax=Oceanicella sp. SM1341 TaxID=1548889 RepID=UPI000E47A9D8|nr:hypothetical protein [Oceanicella sp. SM1341]
MTLPRPQRPGSFVSMVADLVDAIGRKRVEAETSRSQSTISRWCDNTEEHARPIHGPMLDQLCRMFPAQARLPAQYFAALAGGVFIPLESEGGDLAEAGGDVTLCWAETQAALIRALSAASDLPGDLTEAEADDIERKILGVIEESGELLGQVRLRKRPSASRISAVAAE